MTAVDDLAGDAGPRRSGSAISSIGFCVADSPMRCMGCGARRRAAPGTTPGARRAWCPRPHGSRRRSPCARSSILRPDSLVSSRYSDSGVVTRMCGASRRIAARSVCEVSPVRTWARISNAGMPSRVSLRTDPGQRLLEIALDVVRQRLERRHIHHARHPRAGPRRPRARAHRLPTERPPVSCPIRSGRRSARAGRLRSRARRRLAPPSRFEKVASNQAWTADGNGKGAWGQIL